MAQIDVQMNEISIDEARFWPRFHWERKIVHSKIPVKNERGRPKIRSGEACPEYSAPRINKHRHRHRHRHALGSKQHHQSREFLLVVCNRNKQGFNLSQDFCHLALAAWTKNKKQKKTKNTNLSVRIRSNIDMLRNFVKTFPVANRPRSQNFSGLKMDAFSNHVTNYYKVYTAGLAFVTSYAVGTSYIVNLQLRPIEVLIQESKERSDKLSTETKQSIDKLSTESRERTDKLSIEMKQSFDKLEMQMKESNHIINSRVDSALLRSLDLPRAPKPAGEKGIRVNRDQHTS